MHTFIKLCPPGKTQTRSVVAFSQKSPLDFSFSQPSPPPRLPSRSNHIGLAKEQYILPSCVSLSSRTFPAGLV